MQIATIAAVVARAARTTWRVARQAGMRETPQRRSFCASGSEVSDILPSPGRSPRASPNPSPRSSPRHSPRRDPPRTIQDHINSRRIRSVSDWVAPAWCEYNYLYNVLSQSHLPVSQRPTSITTPDGRTVRPDLAALHQQSRTLQGGTDVHTKMELSIQPDQVYIDVRSTEDRWGLALLQFCTLTYAAQTIGRAREIPVFGMLHGAVVRGIIDEVYTDEQQRLVLSETKTRKNMAVPSVADQAPARWQCMLYRRLFCALLMALHVPLGEAAVEEPLELDALWRQVGADPTRPFSEAFRSNIHAWIASEPKALRPQQPFQTMADVLEWARDVLPRRRVLLAPELEIVYVQRTTSHAVGEVHFDDDPSALKKYLDRVRTLWQGERSPEGVSLSLTHRCTHCAWRDQCEWRDEQARAALARAQAARDTRAARLDDTALWDQFDEAGLVQLDW